ncbi:hypothetical protein FN846DRAFT_908161 [Sphaerosporella brunnea]|uniref:Uncharacterized protein n=1 Tax=Sphaerosporella brunnea TaxID=1250544 RepID=A0A5J5EU67_9PEZI|nr:hypothetical protein FN846DRAFT_908161 [Sphaerosporella brunnea]
MPIFGSKKDRYQLLEERLNLVAADCYVWSAGIDGLSTVLPGSQIDGPAFGLSIQKSMFLELQSLAHKLKESIEALKKDYAWLSKKQREVMSREGLPNLEQLAQNKTWIKHVETHIGFVRQTLMKAQEVVDSIPSIQETYKAWRDRGELRGVGVLLVPGFKWANQGWAMPQARADTPRPPTAESRISLSDLADLSDLPAVPLSPQNLVNPGK